MTPAANVRELDIEGMTCASCVARVEKVLTQVPGVTDARVNLATARASLVCPASVSDETLVAAIARAGYGARPHTKIPTVDAGHSERVASVRLVIAVVLSLPLMVLSMHMHPSVLSVTISWILATVVTLGAGAGLHIAAARALRHGSATMDTLVSVGSLSAYGFSAVTVLAHGTHGDTYFDAAGMIVTLVLLGRWLEARARRRTGDALRALADLSPRVARVIRAEGIVEIPLEDLGVGDKVQVRAHERIPADGEVLKGESAVDESMLTGEAMPVAKVVGDAVTGGTINGPGALELRATRVGTEAALGQIMRMVEQAQGSKAPVQRLADRVAAVFVPVVMGVALVTFGVWWLAMGATPGEALRVAVSVLVIACPCALGLATPTAVIVGTGSAASAGILLRDAAAIETLAKLSVVIFDKTGTLTLGRPEVRDVLPAEGYSVDEVWSFAAAVESGSVHPFARAVTTGAIAKGITVLPAREVQQTTSRGVSGTVTRTDGKDCTVTVGAPWGDGGALGAALAALRTQAKTAVTVAVDGVDIGVLGIVDPVHPRSVRAVSALKDLGIEVWMATGDHAGTAAAVAREVDIPEARVRAGMTPGEKAQAVRELRATGKVVGMVGDGVNDAPALAGADVGFAVGTMAGTEVAVEAAGVTLLRDDPVAVADAVRLARRTVAVIRQNLVGSMVYNTVSIPLAALGVLDRLGGPMVAAAAMAMSSVTVVANSLRLRSALKKKHETGRL